MEILRKPTYLKMIENSVGSKIFNSRFIKENKKEFDELEDGNLSCAVFVTSIFKLNNMTDKILSDVIDVETFMEQSNNFEKINTSEIQNGDILIWEGVIFKIDGEPHRHIGFAISNKEAISTSDDHRQVIKHPILYEKGIEKKIRKVEKVFRYGF